MGCTVRVRERERERVSDIRRKVLLQCSDRGNTQAHVLPLHSYIMSQVQHSWLFKAAGSVTKSDIHSTTNSASKTLSHLYWGQTGPRGWILVPLLIFLEKLIMRPRQSSGDS